LATPAKTVVTVVAAEARAELGKAGAEPKADIPRATGKRGKGEKMTKVQPAADIWAIVQEYRALIADQEGLLDESHKTLKVRLGDALVPTRKQLKIKELVTAWAKGGKEGGAITKMDFRKHVRKLVAEPNVQLIDNLFIEMDADGGGSLDTDELTAAMRKLSDEARAKSVSDANVRKHIEWLATREAHAVEVAEQTAEAEAIDRRAQDLAHGSLLSQLDARVGALLVQRNLKVHDLVSTWEHTNGLVDKKQFRKNMTTKMGLEFKSGEKAELFERLDAMFDRFDEDQGGTLDLDELKLALDRLRQASADADAEIVRLKKSRVEVWKQVKVAQHELSCVRKTDEAEASAKEAEKAREAAAAKEDEEARKAEKLAAATEARRKAEEDKAAFAAKVKQRRNSLTSAMPSMSIVAVAPHTAPPELPTQHSNPPAR